MINFLLKSQLINDILNKFIKKKLGYDLGLNISKFDLRDANENFHIFLEVEVNKENTVKVINEMIEKGE